MEIIYYFDKKLGCCPFKKYLEKCILTEKNGNEILVSLKEKINSYLVERDGKTNLPVIKKLSKGYNLFEMKQRKNSKTIIRVIYFIHNNKIILLNAFEKPDCPKYNKKQKNDVEKNILISDEYRKKFLSNPNNYEKYI